MRVFEKHYDRRETKKIMFQIYFSYVSVRPNPEPLEFWSYFPLYSNYTPSLEINLLN